MYVQCGPSMMSFIESIHTLNKRVWIDSIKEYGSTQEVIDGPHCMCQYLLFRPEFFKNSVVTLSTKVDYHAKLEKNSFVNS